MPTLCRFLAGVIVLGNVLSSPVCQAESLEAQLTPLIQPYIDAKAVVGLAVGVIKNDERLLKGFGQLSDSNSEPPEATTLFEIGSISKVFTGILLADATLQGRVRLNQDIHELLPADVRLRPLAGEGDSSSASGITLQQLSTHVSGLPRLPDNFQPANQNDPYADYTVDRMLAFLRTYQRPRAAGIKGEYSNLGAGLLGWLIAEQASTSYESLLATRLLKPLDMHETCVVIPEASKTRFAVPHTGDGQVTLPWNIVHLAGLGGIRSSVGDMLKFIEANLNPPSTALGEAIEMAWEVHQPPIDRDDFAMGLGWMIARDRHTHWHTGGTGGFHSAIFIDRRTKTGVIVLCNSANPDVDALAESLIQKLMGMPVKPRVFEPNLKIAPEKMARYIGRYRLSEQMTFTVSLDGGKLMVGLTGQPTFRVYPKSETEWRYKVVEATLTFQLDEQGNCQALELFQNGARHTAPKVE